MERETGFVSNAIVGSLKKVHNKKVHVSVVPPQRDLIVGFKE